MLNPTDDFCFCPMGHLFVSFNRSTNLQQNSSRSSESSWCWGERTFSDWKLHIILLKINEVRNNHLGFFLGNKLFFFFFYIRLSRSLTTALKLQSLLKPIWSSALSSRADWMWRACWLIRLCCWATVGPKETQPKPETGRKPKDSMRDRREWWRFSTSSLNTRG